MPPAVSAAADKKQEEAPKKEASKEAKKEQEDEESSDSGDESAGQKQRKSLESIVDVRPEIYHSVHCASCQTEVAALNMSDEVYHFFGCLASG